MNYIIWCRGTGEVFPVVSPGEVGPDRYYTEDQVRAALLTLEQTQANKYPISLPAYLRSLVEGKTEAEMAVEERKRHEPKPTPTPAPPADPFPWGDDEKAVDQTLYASRAVNMCVPTITLHSEIQCSKPFIRATLIDGGTTKQDHKITVVERNVSKALAVLKESAVATLIRNEREHHKYVLRRLEQLEAEMKEKG